MSDINYWVGFTIIPGVGSMRFNRLLDYFGSMEKAWQADSTDLRAAGIDTKSVQTIVTRRSQIRLDEIMDKLKSFDVQAIPKNSSDYPPRLKQIYDAPPVLYVKGSLLPDDEWAISVVGTRHATRYGTETTQMITRDLAQNGITIISGLARGIDSVAHKTAIKAGGRTIAVFACGLDIIYPAENKNLSEKILEQGALVSDYPLGTRPRPENFPRRNRIMSGMSLGVLVIEATDQSGALITARFAQEQDREVFAVPGSILSAYSNGPNRLIQDGVKPILQANDILEELNFTMVPQQLELVEAIPANDTESAILKHLGEGPLHIDELCRYSSLPISTVSSALTMMELKGMVYQLDNMHYNIARG